MHPLKNQRTNEAIRGESARARPQGTTLSWKRLGFTKDRMGSSEGKKKKILTCTYDGDDGDVPQESSDPR